MISKHLCTVFDLRYLSNASELVPEQYAPCLVRSNVYGDDLGVVVGISVVANVGRGEGISVGSGVGKAVGSCVGFLEGIKVGS